MATASCSCGEVFHYSDAQSGGRVKCRCGRFVELPVITVASRDPAALDSVLPDRRRMGRREIAFITVVAAVVFAIVLLNVLTKDATKSADGARVTDSSAGAFDRGSLMTSDSTPIGRCSPSDSTAEWRPVANGYEPARVHGNGRGSLTIDNGTSLDAVVWLVRAQSGKASREIYVRAHAVARLRRVSAGDYRVQYENGTTYLVSRHRFCHSEGPLEFDDQLRFEERRSENGSFCYRG